MIFLTRRPRSHEHSPTKEICLSIVGLFLAMGLIGGLAVLVSGLTRNHRFTIVIGAVILGVSAFLCLFLVLFLIFCFNKIFNHQRRSQPVVHTIPINTDEYQMGFQSQRKPSTFTYLNQSHSSVMNTNASADR